jgi:hypothetical protein
MQGIIDQLEQFKLNYTVSKAAIEQREHIVHSRDQQPRHDSLNPIKVFKLF